MLFFNKKNNSSINEKKQSTLGFLFNPEIGNDIRPMGEVIGIFVRFVGLMFAMNGIFPKNHPALLNIPGARITMGEIISTSFRNLKFTREGIPQVLFFFAALGCMIASTIFVIGGALVLFSGKAHAAATCDTTNGMFNPCNTTDLATQWLDYLFYSKPIAGLVSESAIQQGLMTAFSFFSNAVLVIAGLILLYHLLSMIAETAHTGKPMGRANQIWAPIRLAVAIGLLIPIAGGGLNVAQALTVQVAKWGSGLASQTWNIFMNGMQDITNKSITPPNLPPASIQNAVKNIVLIYACQAAWNDEMQKGDFPLSSFSTIPELSTNTGTVGPSSAGAASALITGAATVAGGPLVGGVAAASDNRADALKTICGNIAYATPPGSITSPIKDIYDYYKKGGDFSTTLFTNGKAKAVGQKVLYYLNGPESGLKPPTKDDLTNLNNEMWSLAQAFMKNLAKNESFTKGVDTMMTQSAADGWVSAGSWFNTIARTQSYILDANENAAMKVTGPNMELFRKKGLDTGNPANQETPPDGFLAKIGAAFGKLMDKVEAKASPMKSNMYKDVQVALERFQSDMQTSDPSAATDAAMTGTSGANDNESEITALLLKALDKAGQVFGAWPSNGKLLFEFSSSTNPIADLTRLGHSNLSFGLSLIGASVVLSAGTAIASTAALILAQPEFVVIITLLSDAVSGLATILGVIGGIFITTGVTLAFMLPMVPFIRFFFNVIVWMLVVFEAVVAMPLFALAHLSPYGDGLPGSMAQSGYFFLLSILLRPVLMIFGLIAGLLLFFIAMAFLNSVFLLTTYGSGAYAGFATLSKMIYSVMYVVLAYICANTCFKTISHFPDHALSWMNARGPQTKDLGDQTTFMGTMGAAASYVGGQGIGRLASGASNMAGNASKSFKGMKDQKTSDKAVAGRHEQLMNAQGFIKNPALNNKDLTKDERAKLPEFVQDPSSNRSQSSQPVEMDRQVTENDVPNAQVRNEANSARPVREGSPILIPGSSNFKP